MLGSYTEESYQRVLDAGERGRVTIMANQEKIRDEYYKNPVICLCCGTPIFYENRNRSKFCSRSCSATYNNILRGNIRKEKRAIENLELKEIQNCPNCGKENIKGKFCSRFCNIEYKKKEKYAIIENDELVASSALRRYLMEKFSSKCEKCGWGIPNPVSNTVCLDMHHIDGDHKNCVVSNVELLCTNCHTLTPNYKRVGKKRKSTRTFRNK